MSNRTDSCTPPSRFRCARRMKSRWHQLGRSCHKIDEPVAFSASLEGGNSRLILPKDTVIPFTTSVTGVNVGNFFSNDTASFICPYNGLYLFSVNVQTYDGELARIDAELYQNQIIKTYTWAYNGYGAVDYASSSSVVVLECSAGDRMWVSTATFVAEVNEFYTLPTLNLFTGVLLYNYDI